MMVVLTVLALALLDHAFILHVLVAGLAVEPCPGVWYDIVPPSPLDLLGGLCYEEADGVGGHLAAPRVDGDLGVAAFIRLHFYRQQEQLQLHETQPGVKSWMKGCQVRSLMTRVHCSVAALSALFWSIGHPVCHVGDTDPGSNAVVSQPKLFLFLTTDGEACWHTKFKQGPDLNLVCQHTSHLVIKFWKNFAYRRRCQEMKANWMGHWDAST